MGCGNSQDPKEDSKEAVAVGGGPTPGAESEAAAKATVWGMPPSANAMGAHLFAQHVLGDDKYEFKQCNIMEGEHKTAEFAAINPFTAIPMFKDTDGTCMGESTAILLHLEAKYGNKMADSMCTWALMMRTDKIYSGGWSDIVYPVLGFMPAVSADVLKAAIDGLYKNLATYENTFLKGKTFVGGDAPCVADFAVAPLIFGLKHQTIKDATGFVLPESWCTYVDAFIAKVPGAAMLSSAGGFSIGEMMDSKKPDKAVDPVAAEAYTPSEYKKGEASAKATVWGMPPSANAMGAHLFAQHVLGDDKYEFKQCNIMEGEHKTPEFAAINPFTAIPMFKDTDGTCMGESTAILLHLEAKYGNKMADSMCTWALMMRTDKIYSGGWSDIVYPVLGFMPAVSADVLKAAIDGLYTNLATYENTFLKGKTFVGGDAPCVADFAMAPLIFALKHQTIKDATGFVLPERWCTYMDAFIGKVPGAAILSSAGGFSIGEMMDSN